MASKAYVASLTLSELKRELKQRGLSARGSKRDLRDRLEQALDEEELDDPSSESETEGAAPLQGTGFNFEVLPESFIKEETPEEEVEPMIVSVELSSKENLEVYPHRLLTDEGWGQTNENKGPMIVAIELKSARVCEEQGNLSPLAEGREIAGNSEAQMTAQHMETAVKQDEREGVGSGLRSTEEEAAVKMEDGQGDHVQQADVPEVEMPVAVEDSAPPQPASSADIAPQAPRTCEQPVEDIAETGEESVKVESSCRPDQLATSDVREEETHAADELTPLDAKVEEPCVPDQITLPSVSAQEQSGELEQTSQFNTPPESCPMEEQKDEEEPTPHVEEEESRLQEPAPTTEEEQLQEPIPHKEEERLHEEDMMEERMPEVNIPAENMQKNSPWSVESVTESMREQSQHIQHEKVEGTCRKEDGDNREPDQPVELLVDAEQQMELDQPETIANKLEEIVEETEQQIGAEVLLPPAVVDERGERSQTCDKGSVDEVGGGDGEGVGTVQPEGSMLERPVEVDQQCTLAEQPVESDQEAMEAKQAECEHPLREQQDKDAADSSGPAGEESGVLPPAGEESGVLPSPNAGEESGMSPPAGEESGVLPSAGEESGVSPPAGEESKVSLPAGEESGVSPPAGEESGVSPSAGEESGVLPSAGEESEVPPPAGEESGVSPPVGEESGVLPPAGEESGVSPPAGEESGVPLPAGEESGVLPPAGEESKVSLPASEESGVPPPAGEESKVSLPAGEESGVSPPAGEESGMLLPAGEELTERVSTSDSNLMGEVEVTEQEMDTEPGTTPEGEAEMEVRTPGEEEGSLGELKERSEIDSAKEGEEEGPNKLLKNCESVDEKAAQKQEEEEEEKVNQRGEGDKLSQGEGGDPKPVSSASPKEAEQETECVDEVEAARREDPGEESATPSGERAAGGDTDRGVDEAKPDSGSDLEQGSADATLEGEVSQLGLESGQIDVDVLVHAEEDDLSVFSTEAAEAQALTTTRDRDRKAKHSSSSRRSNGYSRKREQVASSRSGNEASQTRKSPPDSSKRQREHKSEPQCEQPSIKRRRISAQGSSSVDNGSSGSGHQERRRRWGSGKQRSGSTSATTISSDVLKDIIPAGLEEEGGMEGGGVATATSALDSVMGYGGEEEEGEVVSEKGTGEEETEGKGNQLLDAEHQREWEDVEKEREMQRRAVERARQEVETRKRIEARLRAKQQVEAKLKMEEKVKHRMPSPARNPPSRILHVEHLTRPFTIMQLRELLTQDGPMISDSFWTNKIKSHCIVLYKSQESAVATRTRIHGIKWPSTNPKLLCVEYLTPDDVERITDGDMVVRMAEDEAEEENEEKEEEGEVVRESGEEEKMEVEEEGGRGEEVVVHGTSTKIRQASTSSPPAPPSPVGVEKRAVEGEVSPPPAKKETDKTTKLLDELFRKTKTTPSIYWLPLNDAQVKERQDLMRAREAEREKQRQERARLRQEEREREEKERREREERNRKERERRIREERERRARERMRRRSRSRSRSRSRDRRRR